MLLEGATTGAKSSSVSSCGDFVLSVRTGVARTGVREKNALASQPCRAEEQDSLPNPLGTHSDPASSSSREDGLARHKLETTYQWRIIGLNA